MRALLLVLLFLLPGLCAGQKSFEGLIHYQEALYDPVTGEEFEGPYEWSVRYVKGMKYYFVMPNEKGDFNRGFVDYEARRITMFSEKRKAYFEKEFVSGKATLVETDTIELPAEWDAQVYLIHCSGTMCGIFVSLATNYDNLWWFDLIDYDQAGPVGTYGFMKISRSIDPQGVYKLYAARFEPRKVSSTLFEVPEGYKRLKKVPKQWRKYT